jgi:hypothetical protein
VVAVVVENRKLLDLNKVTGWRVEVLLSSIEAASGFLEATDVNNTECGTGTSPDSRLATAEFQ